MLSNALPPKKLGAVVVVPNPPKPPAAVAVPPNPPNSEDCVVPPPNSPPPVPRPKPGVLVPKRLGVEVVVPKVDPKRGAGAEVVTVPPNRLWPVEAAGAPKRLVDWVGTVEPKRPVEVAAEENRLGVVVWAPKREGLLAAAEPNRPVPVEDTGAPNVEPIVK